MNPTTQPAELERPDERLEQDPGDDVRAVVRFARRRWRVIAAFAVLGALVGGIRGIIAGPAYEASATIVFNVDPVSRLAGLPDEFLAEGDFSQPGSASQTRMMLVKQRDVGVVVRRRLGATESRRELEDKIRVEQDGVSSLYRIIATDEDGRDAQRLANTWADTFARQRERELDRRLTRGIRVLRSEARSPETPSTRKVALREQIERLTFLRAAQRPTVEVVNEAQVPSQPVGPGPVVIAFAGLIVGLVLGFGVAVLLDTLSRREPDPA